MAHFSNDTPKYDLFNFLEEHRCAKGTTYSHTSMSAPLGSFFIKANELDYFYQLYEIALVNKKNLHITEKHDDIGPLLVDLDFRYNIEVSKRVHTQEHIEQIVELYISEICDIFEILPTDKRLTCFVFEREKAYISNNMTKDGIHIMFPHIICKPTEQYIIRENIIGGKKITNILANLPLKNKISEVVDRAIIEVNPWLMFGSKKPNCEPYKLTYIFNGQMKNINLDEYEFKENNFAKFFSIRNKKESDLIPIKNTKLDIVELYNSKKKPVKAKVSYKINYDIEQIKEFISLLNPSRADNYTEWVQIGWALHNIDPNSEELLDIWIEFSKNSSKFKEGECEKEWERSKTGGLTIRSIYHWARNDNPKAYENIMSNDIKKLIVATTKDANNYDVAKVLFTMFQYDFKYSGSEWYVFKNHVWSKESDGYSVRTKISNDLRVEYIKLITEYNKINSHDGITEEEKEENKKKSKTIYDITNKLGQTAFKDCIMKECKELFYDKDFVNKLDSNPYLIGFTNGIYDLQKGELRAGNPEDYVEMNTDIEKIEFNKGNEYWPDLQHFINTVFVDGEVRNYFLTYLSSCLQGVNAEEKFRYWTGVGCHSINTDITMYDSTVKKVQHIVLGDILMGDDGTPRNVLELKCGFGKMYEFNGYGFQSFIVNEDHILCLCLSGSSTDQNKTKREYIEISVRDFLDLPVEDKKILYLYNKRRFMFDFTVRQVDDDYFYGFELDGNHCYQMGNSIITHNSNGKSKILELFTHSFGQYTYKFPITMLTGKRAASNACTPEIVGSKGKRFGYFEEPSEGEKINAGFLKELTGGDKIKARGLHKDPIEFKPQFKLTLLCNDMPEAPANDSGIWRRLEVIEFKSRFCENPKEPHEYPIDKNLSEKLKNWKELFMALLLDIYYVQYKKNGMKVPSEIVKYTLEFQKQCDLYTDFIMDNIEDTKNNANTVDIGELYDEFKVWYEDAFSNLKYPSKIDFRKYLIAKYGKKRVTTKEIKGFQFKSKIDTKNEIKMSENDQELSQNNELEQELEQDLEMLTNLFSPLDDSVHLPNSQNSQNLPNMLDAEKEYTEDIFTGLPIVKIKSDSGY